MLSLKAVQALWTHARSFRDQAGLGTLAGRPRGWKMPEQHGRGIVWAWGAVPSPGRNQNPGSFSAMALFTDLELVVETGVGAKPLTPWRRPCCFSGTQVPSYLKAGTGDSTGIDIARAGAAGLPGKVSQGCCLVSASHGRLCQASSLGRASC